MISKKIDGVIIAMNDLAGQVSTEVWEIISCAQRELRDASEQASHLEQTITMADLEGAN